MIQVFYKSASLSLPFYFIPKGGLNAFATLSLTALLILQAPAQEPLCFCLLSSNSNKGYPSL